MNEKIISKKIAINLFVDLLIADILLVVLLAPAILTSIWYIKVLFLIVLWFTSHSLAIYARGIFPKKVKNNVSKSSTE